MTLLLLRFFINYVCSLKFPILLKWFTQLIGFTNLLLDPRLYDELLHPCIFANSVKLKVTNFGWYSFCVRTHFCVFEYRYFLRFISSSLLLCFPTTKPTYCRLFEAYIAKLIHYQTRFWGQISSCAFHQRGLSVWNLSLKHVNFSFLTFPLSFVCAQFTVCTMNYGLKGSSPLFFVKDFRPIVVLNVCHRLCKQKIVQGQNVSLFI